MTRRKRLSAVQDERRARVFLYPTRDVKATPQAPPVSLRSVGHIHNVVPIRTPKDAA